MPSSDSDEDFRPKAKKAKKDKGKKAKKKYEEDSEEDSDSDEGGVQRNDDGEAYVDLGKSRRCTVRKWKKAVLVDIRECYEKNGKMLPGKKGISLTVAQYEALKAAVKDGSLDDAIEELEE